MAQNLFVFGCGVKLEKASTLLWDPHPMYIYILITMSNGDNVAYIGALD